MTPTQRIEHLGLIIDSLQGLFEVPTAKLTRLRQDARDIRIRAKKARRWFPKQALASFCGQVQALKLALPLVDFHLRALYDAVASRAGWRGDVKLSRQAFSDLQFWATMPSFRAQRLIYQSPTSVRLFVDASDEGWGATMGSRIAHGFWAPWERSLPICLRELRAVRLAVKAFHHFVRNRTVLLGEDNQPVLFGISRLTSRAPAMMAEIRHLVATLEGFNTRLIPTYVRSEDNPADGPSRLQDRHDYQLHPTIFRWADRRFGPHTVDAFATASNAQLPRFWSRFFDPASEAVDAFAQSWQDEHIWANPPFTNEVLSRVVAKLQEDHATATVCVPYWPQHQWFGQLLRLATSLVIIPSRTGLFAPASLGNRVFLPAPDWDVALVQVRPRYNVTSTFLRHPIVRTS